MSIQKLKPRTNGDLSKPKWEQDDELDQLGDKLAQLDEVPQLPPQTPSGKSDVKPPAKPQVKPKPAPAAPKAPETVNVKELMNTLLEAWTNPTVRMWIEGSDLCFEQIDEESRVKNTWRVGFSHVKTSSVKLIK